MIFTQERPVPDPVVVVCHVTVVAIGHGLLKIFWLMVFPVELLNKNTYSGMDLE